MKRLVVVLHPDESVRESLGHLLRSEGFFVWTSSTSVEALEVCRTERPAVVITSLFSYWRDGAAQEIVVDLRTEFPSVVIITLSGDGAKEADARAKAFGATHHFHTPVAFHLLVDAITQSCD